jgi:uncharacterized membrane protein YciS (DUF1049 family)
MDKVLNLDSYIRMPSSQTYRSELNKLNYWNKQFSCVDLFMIIVSHANGLTAVLPFLRWSWLNNTLKTSSHLQNPHSTSITVISVLMIFRDTTTVGSENQINPTNKMLPRAEYRVTWRRKVVYIATFALLNYKWLQYVVHHKRITKNYSRKQHYKKQFCRKSKEKKD